MLAERTQRGVAVGELRPDQAKLLIGETVERWRSEGLLGRARISRVSHWAHYFVDWLIHRTVLILVSLAIASWRSFWRCYTTTSSTIRRPSPTAWRLSSIARTPPRAHDCFHEKAIPRQGQRGGHLLSACLAPFPSALFEV